MCSNVVGSAAPQAVRIEGAFAVRVLPRNSELCDVKIHTLVAIFWHSKVSLRTRSESALIKSAHKNMNKQKPPEPEQAVAGSQFSLPASPESPENGGDGLKIEPAKASSDVSGEGHADPNGAGSKRPES